MKVNYSSESYEYLQELVDILFENDYFGFREDAKEYVQRLINYIENNIFTKSKYIAPKYFNRYGKNLFYIFYKPNKRTTWFVFFQLKDNVYLIKYITNNHVSGVHIRELKNK